MTVEWPDFTDERTDAEREAYEMARTITDLRETIAALRGELEVERLYRQRAELENERLRAAKGMPKRGEDLSAGVPF